jgi:endonuclease/exonuclease/phosphatase family metal-dependent hydrolase
MSHFRNFIIILALLLWNFSMAQDTVRVMHYNLLYYGVTIFDCNSTTNNINKKNAALRDIIDYVKPDIFTVNEISKYTSYHDQILDSVLNINGINYYARAGLTNFSNTVIVNQLYYDTQKFGIVSEYALVGGDRDINVYKLYYKSPELAWSTDTVFLTVIVGHLASGSYTEDATRRDNEAALVMNHVASLPNPHNYLFQGDFNVYGASEPAFQRMINNSNANIRFYDPVNKIGEWNSNPTYAAYHTQSTHTTSDCFIGGGLDDRFDFILASLPIIMETYRIKYVPGTYTTVGQDGLHYNDAINDAPANTSAPSDVIQALYDMSDHLPVYLDLKINQTPAGIQSSSLADFKVFPNPATDKLYVDMPKDAGGFAHYEIFDLQGRLLSKGRLHGNSIDVSGFSQGMYILTIETGGHRHSVKWVRE